MSRSVTRLFLTAGCAAWLAGCTVGPDYRQPEIDTPDAYKAASLISLGSSWKPAEPRDIDALQDWWTLYSDPTLGELIDQVSISNLELAQAEARYRQALAVLRGARSGLFPSAGAGATYSRSGTGTGSRDGFVGDSTRRGGDEYNLNLNLSWELDLWGGLRRQLEASRASAMASAAELAAARLSMQSTLAQSYFQLRIIDQQRKLFEQTLEAYQRSLELTENQYRAGLAAKADVVQAQTQLETTRAQAIDLEWQRDQLENAIAVMIGVVPADFNLPPQELQLELPTVPVAVPSTLLERRPDIAASERSVAAANASIGVAQAAYFPSLTLSARGGYQHSSYSGWLDAPNRYWSLGPALAATLFDGGRRRADKEQAVALYDESVARYRHTVLESFREVEDALTQLQSLAREAEVRRRAVSLAEEAERLVTNRYRAGLVSFLNVANAQTVTLENRRSALALLGNQLTASMQLMVALGGGWHNESDTASLSQPSPAR